MTRDRDGETLLVDLDNRDTWPTDVRKWVDPHAARLAEADAPSVDAIPVSVVEAEDEFRALLAGTKLIAYHCTRLLEYERERFRRQGLQPLSSDALADRVEAAHEAGFLNAADRAAFLAENAADAENRAGQVCLSLGRDVFGQDPWGCEPLLSCWGGEALYRGASGREERLSGAMGRPAIVVAAIDLRGSWRSSPAHPFLVQLFVAKAAGSRVWADVFYRRAVEPGDILAIWQPGDPEYDRFEGLPKK